MKNLIKNFENVDFISLAKDAYGTQLSEGEKQNIVRDSLIDLVQSLK